MVMDEDRYISVVDVRDYVYCPRVIFFKNVLHLKERVTEAMLYGKESHEEPPIAPLAPKLRPAKIIKGIELISHRLKLRGKVDMIIITKHGEYVPVEVKWSEANRDVPKRQHKAQIVAYAILIEENFNTTVKRGLIYYSRSKRFLETSLTSRDKWQVEKYIKQIYQIIKSEEIPYTRQDLKHCQDCGYKHYCNHR